MEVVLETILIGKTQSPLPLGTDGCKDGCGRDGECFFAH